ncbi:hypothetical protein SARC_05086 [Sphaeroforma arctica JP610]|uniref:MYND-type domain-containing protein n=1 Tax=Sphaeroforma arctica JP610 TaxID=667725 RepID=A0A0L0G0P6_9EUKA|nr:hypothetical protein SARC_05086 [Sphaeroforma arctica JP610]KNC82630.1 hypothetical protein SARC_05086 [Sphaeroforma arctica JP610]|eukprot:XP_014156532.1 hypothetical protein SARC_05086 [Sphaeroforma arctica JP610]
MASPARAKGLAMICVMCAKPPELSCPCLERYYCSRDCQRVDWKEKGHKTACKNFNTVRKVGSVASSRNTPQDLKQASTPHSGVKYTAAASGVGTKSQTEDISFDATLATTTPTVANRDALDHKNTQVTTASAAIKSTAVGASDSRSPVPNISSDKVVGSASGESEASGMQRPSAGIKSLGYNTTRVVFGDEMVNPLETVHKVDKVVKEGDASENAPAHDIMADGGGVGTLVAKTTGTALTEHNTGGDHKDTDLGTEKDVGPIGKDLVDVRKVSNDQAKHVREPTIVTAHVTRTPARPTNMHPTDMNIGHKDAEIVTQEASSLPEVEIHFSDGFRGTETKSETAKKRARKGPSMSEAFSGGWGEHLQRSHSTGMRRVRSKSVSRSSSRPTTDNCGGRLARAKSVSHIPSRREVARRASVSVPKHGYTIRAQSVRPERKAADAQPNENQRPVFRGKEATAKEDKVLVANNKPGVQTAGLDVADTPAGEGDVAAEPSTNSGHSEMVIAKAPSQSVVSASQTDVPESDVMDISEMDNAETPASHTKHQTAPQPTAAAKRSPTGPTAAARARSTLDSEEMAMDSDGVAQIQLDDWQVNVAGGRVSAATVRTKTHGNESTATNDTQSGKGTSLGGTKVSTEGVTKGRAKEVNPAKAKGVDVNKAAEVKASSEEKNVEDSTKPSQLDTVESEVDEVASYSRHPVPSDERRNESKAARGQQSAEAQSLVGSDQGARHNEFQQAEEENVEESVAGETKAKSNTEKSVSETLISKQPAEVTDSSLESVINGVAEDAEGPLSFDGFVKSLQENIRRKNQGNLIDSSRHTKESTMKQQEVGKVSKNQSESKRDQDTTEHTHATGPIQDDTFTQNGTAESAKASARKSRPKTKPYEAKKRANKKRKVPAATSHSQDGSVAVESAEHRTSNKPVTGPEVSSAPTGKYPPRVMRSAKQLAIMAGDGDEGTKGEDVVELTSEDEELVPRASPVKPASKTSRQASKTSAKTVKAKRNPIKSPSVKEQRAPSRVSDTDKNTKRANGAQKRKASGQQLSRTQARSRNGDKDSTENGANDPRLALKLEKKKKELAKLTCWDFDPAEVQALPKGRATRSGNAIEAAVPPTLTPDVSVSTNAKSKAKTSGKSAKSKTSGTSAETKTPSKRAKSKAFGKDTTSTSTEGGKSKGSGKDTASTGSEGGKSKGSGKDITSTGSEGGKGSKLFVDSGKDIARPHVTRRRLRQANEGSTGSKNTTADTHRTAKKRTRSETHADSEYDSDGDDNAEKAKAKKVVNKKTRVSGGVMDGKALSSSASICGKPSRTTRARARELAGSTGEDGRAFSTETVYNTHAEGQLTVKPSGSGDTVVREEESDSELDFSGGFLDSGDDVRPSISLNSTDSGAQYVCRETHCGRSFALKAQLNAHSTAKHGRSTALHCLYDSCTQIYECRSELNVHVIVDHLRLRPFKCEFSSCAERFASHAERFRHMRVHVKGQAYACKHHGCNYTSRSKIMRNTHMATHRVPVAQE